MTNRFLPRQSRRELDSVVATQAALPGQPLGSLHHGFRGRHPHKIRPISSEPSFGVPRNVVRDDARADSLGERRRDFSAAGDRRGGHFGISGQGDRSREPRSTI